ncbi:MAG: tetratricopeptide repeat protein [Candidatus Heimdallarchaeota archaeon]|nr:tetratricopeptide repeat protein [Candidatus Heimdallarchaeota archaeon]
MSYFKQILGLFRYRLNKSSVRAELVEANTYFQEEKFEELERIISDFHDSGLNKHELMLYKYLKAQVLMRNNQVNLANEHISESLTLAQELSDYNLQLLIYLSRAETCYISGKLESTIEAVQAAEDILETLEDMDDDEKYGRLRTLTNLKGAIFSSQGKFNEAIEAYEKGLEYATQVANKRGEAIAYNNMGTSYQNLGDIDLALEYYEKSMKIKDELGDIDSAAITRVNLAEINILKGYIEEAERLLLESLEVFRNKGFSIYVSGTLFSIIKLLAYSDIERATQFLQELRELNDKFTPRNEIIFQQMRISEGLILRQSSRSSKKAEAQRIFEAISKEKMINFELTIFAKLNFIELLLFEFKLSPSNDILKEIKDNISELFELAKSQNALQLIVEIYILQSKIALIDTDIELANKLISQADLIVSERGFKNLMKKVSDQYDIILDSGEGLDNDLTIRLKQIGLEDNILRMIRREISEIEEKEDEPVLLLIINKAGLSIYSHKFGDKNFLDDQLISGFISAINAFSREAFLSSGSIERIKHHNYTLTMKPHEEFLFCYAFNENSFSATKKLEHFINSLNNKGLMQELSRASRIGIYQDDNSNIDLLVKEIFRK